MAFSSVPYLWELDHVGEIDREPFGAANRRQRRSTFPDAEIVAVTGQRVGNGELVHARASAG